MISREACPRMQRKPWLSGFSGSPRTPRSSRSSTSTSIPQRVGWQFIGHIVRMVAGGIAERIAPCVSLLTNAVRLPIVPLLDIVAEVSDGRHASPINPSGGSLGVAPLFVHGTCRDGRECHGDGRARARGRLRGLSPDAHRLVPNRDRANRRGALARHERRATG